MSSGIGSIFEMSLRIMLLLKETDEKLDEEQIGALDFAAVYAADFDVLDENLHGYGSYRYSEYLARKSVISTALRSLVLNGRIILYPSNSGYRYELSTKGKEQCAALKNEYADEYILAVNAVIQKYGINNLQRLIVDINERID